MFSTNRFKWYWCRILWGEWYLQSRRKIGLKIKSFLGQWGGELKWSCLWWSFSHVNFLAQAHFIQTRTDVCVLPILHKMDEGKRGDKNEHVCTPMYVRSPPQKGGGVKIYVQLVTAWIWSQFIMGAMCEKYLLKVKATKWFLDMLDVIEVKKKAYSVVPKYKIHSFRRP